MPSKPLHVSGRQSVAFRKLAVGTGSRARDTSHRLLRATRRPSLRRGSRRERLVAGPSAGRSGWASARRDPGSFARSHSRPPPAQRRAVRDVRALPPGSSSAVAEATRADRRSRGPSGAARPALPPSLPPDAFRRRVYVEAVVAKESHESHPEAFRGRDREARWSADGRKDRNSCRDGLLNHLVPGASTHRQHRPLKRQPAIEQSPPHHLVDGIVPADVLTQELQFTLLVEEPGRVKASRRLEDALLLAETIGKPRQHGGVDRESTRESREIERERVHGRGAAHPARGTGQERTLRPAPRSPAEINVYLIRFDKIVRERHTRLVLLGLGADADTNDVIERPDDLLGPEQSERELEVVPRGPHDDRKGLPIERQLKRLFGGDLIAVVAPVAGAPARDLDRGSLGTRHRTMLGGR